MVVVLQQYILIICKQPKSGQLENIVYLKASMVCDLIGACPLYTLSLDIVFTAEFDSKLDILGTCVIGV